MFHGVAPRDKDANLLNIINKTSIKSVKVVRVENLLLLALANKVVLGRA
jgi:hypothetical protein